MNILQSGICNVILTAGADTNTIGTFVSQHINSDFVLGTAVAGLIFILLLIYLFNFSNLAKNVKTDQGNTQVNIKDEIKNEIKEVDLTSNTELVAVITAAIMASMGNEAPADGLYIRSIKRSSENKWKKA